MLGGPQDDEGVRQGTIPEGTATIGALKADIERLNTFKFRISYYMKENRNNIEI